MKRLVIVTLILAAYTAPVICADKAEPLLQGITVSTASGSASPAAPASSKDVAAASLPRSESTLTASTSADLDVSVRTDVSETADSEGCLSKCRSRLADRCPNTAHRADMCCTRTKINLKACLASNPCRSALAIAGAGLLAVGGFVGSYYLTLVAD